MPREAEYELLDLVIEEGSLVGKGDNPEAHVCLFKVKEDEEKAEEMEDEEEKGEMEEEKGKDEDYKAKVFTLVTEDVDKSDVQKPSTDNHVASLADPGNFKRFRRGELPGASGASAIFGVKEDGATEIQSVHFDRTKFTPEQAKAWLESNNFGTDGFQQAKKGLPMTLRTFFNKLFNWAEAEPEAEEIEKEPRTTDQILARDEFHSKFFKLRMAFTESVHSIIEDAEPAQMPSLLQQSAQEFSDGISEMRGELSKRDPESVSKLDAILDQITGSVSKEGRTQRKAFAQAVEDLQRFEVPQVSEPEEPKVSNSEKKSLDDVLSALSEDDQSIVKSALEAKTKEESNTPQPEPEPEVKKSASEVALEKQLQDVQEELQKMRDEKELQRYVQKAKDEGYPGDVNKTAQLLKNAYAVSDDMGEAYEESLKAAAEQTKLNQSIFASMGTTGASVELSKGEDKIEKMTKKFMDQNPGVPYHEAYVKVLDAASEEDKASLLPDLKSN